MIRWKSVELKAANAKDINEEARGAGWRNGSKERLFCCGKRERDQHRLSTGVHYILLMVTIEQLFPHISPEDGTDPVSETYSVLEY